MKDAQQIRMMLQAVVELEKYCAQTPDPEIPSIKAAVEKLRQQMTQFADGFIDFRNIIDHLPDEFYVTDNTGCTLYINEAYSKGTGIQADEVVGKRMDELEQYFSKPVVPMVIERKEIVNTLASVKTINRQVFLRGVPVFDSDGELEYVVANDHDSIYLTQLKEQFETLQAAKSKNDAEIQYLRQQQNGQRKICFKSRPMARIMELVEKIAPSDATVLITGESGTGKEVIADAIYERSSRVKQPFIKINCAAIPAQLLESELFGYEEGAFTGANKKGKIGLFELANHGTIFLDEIGDMSKDLQSKVLRTLQQQEIIRVGGKKAIKLDLRIIAATNKDLKKEVQEKRFREDLYYRLNVVPIEIPPLRERPDDIKPLAQHFLERFCRQYHKSVSLSSDVIKSLMSYPWPGNIRELENFMERLAVIHTNGKISKEEVLPMLNPHWNEIELEVQDMGTLKDTIHAVERNCILRALRKYGSKRKAAKVLGVSHSTLVLKCQQLGVNEMMTPEK